MKIVSLLIVIMVGLNYAGSMYLAITDDYTIIWFLPVTLYTIAFFGAIYTIWKEINRE